MKIREKKRFLRPQVRVRIDEKTQRRLAVVATRVSDIDLGFLYVAWIGLPVNVRSPRRDR
jgi:hypothetical protein